MPDKDNPHIQTVLDILKSQEPKTTQELIDRAQKKTGLSRQEIKNLVMELENSGKIRFSTPQPSQDPDFRAYAFSGSAIWFWATVAMSLATVASIFLIPENLYPLVYIRNVLGIVFVLFLPGYTFIKMLFPAKPPIKTQSQELDGIVRLALSIGMSLALSPIIGLILNYTPWGIRLVPVTLTMLAATLTFAAAALIREQQTHTTAATAQTHPLADQPYTPNGSSSKTKTDKNQTKNIQTQTASGQGVKKQI